MIRFGGDAYMSVGVRRITGYLLLAAMCALAAQGWSVAQETRPPGAQPDNGGRGSSSFPDYPTLSITEVANEAIGSNHEITLETLSNIEGEDVKIEAWAIPANTSIWILVNPGDSRYWRAYGPARSEGGDIYMVRGVRLGEESLQRRSYRFRAVALRQPPVEGEFLSKEWQDKAEAVSLPVRVIVESRVILGEETPGISIVTINKRTVDPHESMVVPASADMSGTLRLPKSEGGQKEHDSQPFVYVIVHTPATDKWRIVGRAEISNFKWEIRDVVIIDMGEPHQVSFELLAFISREAISPGLVSYDTWWHNAVAASPSIKVVTDPLPKVPIIEGPELTLPRLVTRDGRDDASAPQALENIVGVEGEVKNLPMGASIWVLVNPLGSQMWITHGPALLRGNTWTLPVTRFATYDHSAATHFRILAILSTKIISPGLTDYNTWCREALTISPILMVRNGNRQKGDESSAITLSISRVAGISIEPGSYVQVPNSGDIEGSVEGLPPNGFLWAAIHEEGSKRWLLKGPALIKDEQWIVPDVIFAPEPEGDKKVYKRFEIAAIVTDFSISIDDIDTSQLLYYAQTVSPIAHIIDGPVGPAQGSSGVTMTLLWFVLLLVLLILLEYFFRLVSIIAEQVASLIESLISHIRNKFPWLESQTTSPLPVLGLVILILGLYAIYNYFPLYSHVLEKQFSLSPRIARGLAMILIIFVGVGGVLLHATKRYLGRDELAFDYMVDQGNNQRAEAEDQIAEPAGHKGTLVRDTVLVLLLLVILVLWLFQFVIYYEYYSDNSKTELAALGLGGAAFFIAGIETYGFYWATHLGFGLLVWVAISVLIFGPLYLSAKACRVIGLAFHSLPSRVEAMRESRNRPDGIIRIGMIVSCIDGEVGKIEAMQIHTDKAQPQSLIVRMDEAAQPDGLVEIPIGWIGQIDHEQIILSRTKEQLAQAAKRL
jgi:hypothetical protein